jgi:4-hydroxybenzoate polyprenyltransferase
MGTASPSAAQERSRGQAASALAALRPAEWVKNLFVLAPLGFSGRLDASGAVGDALLAFAAFCAMSSAGYLVNDIVDAELDRRHPIKRRRPIATGELSPSVAALLALALALTALGVALLAEWEVAAAVGGYGALTVAYTLALKQLVIVDVMTIAGCFLLRVWAGALAVDAGASEWLLVCTGMLALFLGFTKRRQEAVSELHAGAGSRPVLEHYSLAYLDQMVALVTAGTVMSYAIYAVDSPLVGDEMLATAPPVLYGIFRYLYLIYDRGDERDAVTLVTRDAGMIIATVVWAASGVVLLYLV